MKIRPIIIHSLSHIRKSTTTHACRAADAVASILFAKRGIHSHVLWYCRGRVSNSDTEDNKLLNKVIIFVFFAHRKCSCSFIKLMLNRRCHMDYFNNVFTNFPGLGCGSCIAVYAGSESS